MLHSQIAEQVIAVQINTMQDNLIIYKNLLSNLSSKQSKSSLAAGTWSIEEIVCHLSEFESIFLARVQLVIKENMPDLAVASTKPKELTNSKHKNRSLADCLNEYELKRKKSIEYIEQIDPSDLSKIGIHPQYGRLSLLEIILRFSAHDINHLKQITNILKEHNEI